MPAHHVAQHSDDKNTTPPASIDISKMENSDTVQSHVSISNSSKRLRISPSWNASDIEATPDDVEVSVQHQSNHKKTDHEGNSTTLDNCPTVLNSTATRTTFRPVERGYVRPFARCALLIYCFVSCVIAIIRFYMYFNEPHPQVTERHRPFAPLPTMEAIAMSNYLTKATSPVHFEPFVLSNEVTTGNVSLVGWLADSEVDSIRTWQRAWPGPLSILVSTTAAVGSSLHANILEKLQAYRNDELSIHLLFVKPNVSPTPNVYLNLARLMAKTNWTLLLPTDSTRPIISGLHRASSGLDSDARNGPIMLTTGSSLYPFPLSTAILIKRDSNLWCTERMFLDPNRDSNWNECLWQITLETYGMLDVVKLPSKFDTSKGERSNVVLEGWTQQRLRARFRTEMCDVTSKYLTTVTPRNRYRAMKVEWAKEFCAKTIEKKWTSQS